MGTQVLGRSAVEGDAVHIREHRGSWVAHAAVSDGSPFEVVLCIGTEHERGSFSRDEAADVLERTCSVGHYEVVSAKGRELAVEVSKAQADARVQARRKTLGR